MKNITIGTKVLLAFIIISLISMGVMGIISYNVGVSTLEDESYNKLTVVREMKANQIEDYFDFINNQLITTAENPSTISAINDFSAAVALLDGELNYTVQEFTAAEEGLHDYYTDEFLPRLNENSTVDRYILEFDPVDRDTILLQSIYISENTNDTGLKYLLDDADDGTTYSDVHSNYHPVIKDFLERFGYYDIFLVDINTDKIVYSVFKEVDFGTSLVDGPYSDSNIGDVYQAAKQINDSSVVSIEDFRPYEPSYLAAASFVAVPVFDNGVKIGVLIFQLPVDEINNIMVSNEEWKSVGLGDSGETYIVGDDLKLRSESRFFIEDKENYLIQVANSGLDTLIIQQINNQNSSIGLQIVDTAGTRDALLGNTGTQVFNDYRDVSILSSYRPLEIEGLDWVIMSEIDEDEAFAAIGELANRMIYGVLGLLAVILTTAIVFSRSITNPINKIALVADNLAHGDLDVEIMYKENKDEIGTLAKSFEFMRVSMKKMISELKKFNEELEDKVSERTQELKESKQEIQEQLDFNQILLDKIPSPLFVVDAEAKMFTMNKAYETAYGVTKEDYIGKTALELDYIPDDQVEELYQQNLTMIEKGTSEEVDITELFKDGTSHDMLFLKSGFHLSNGKKGGLIGLLIDITPQKELERLLEKANETMVTELDFAREIQMNMLPLIFPAYPDRKEIAVNATLHPARQVGGDFYDFYFLDNDHFCFVIGDVSGKGAPGALLMAVSKTLIKSRATDDFIPSSILTHVNNELSENNESCMFVTVFLGVINMVTGQLSYCNAGHNPPYILKADGDLIRLDALHGPVIGAIPNLPYKQDEIKLDSEDLVYLYTDGVNEAENEAGDMYTEDTMVKVLKKYKKGSKKTLVDTMLKEVQDFVQDAEPSDDITILQVRYTGYGKDDKRDSLSIQIENKFEEMERVVLEFEKFCKKTKIPDTVRQQVDVVFDELLNNIISYAYKDKKKHLIDIQFDLINDRLVMEIKDDGVPFNPFSQDPPNVKLSVDERDIGGLGIFLVKKMMDEYIYRRQVGKNIVSLVKKIEMVKEKTKKVTKKVTKKGEK